MLSQQDYYPKLHSHKSEFLQYSTATIPACTTGLGIPQGMAISRSHYARITTSPKHIPTKPSGMVRRGETPSVLNKATTATGSVAESTSAGAFGLFLLLLKQSFLTILGLELALPPKLGSSHGMERHALGNVGMSPRERQGIVGTSMQRFIHTSHGGNAHGFHAKGRLGMMGWWPQNCPEQKRSDEHIQTEMPVLGRTPLASKSSIDSHGQNTATTSLHAPRVISLRHGQPRRSGKRSMAIRRATYALQKMARGTGLQNN